MKTMTDEEYIKTAGKVCPFCRAPGSYKLQGVTNPAVNVVHLQNLCQKCGKMWVDCWVMTGFEELTS